MGRIKNDWKDEKKIIKPIIHIVSTDDGEPGAKEGWDENGEIRHPIER